MKTREVKIGKVKIGGSNPVAVQSMTTTKTHDARATIEQIHRLEEAGCEIVRVSVPDEGSAKALREIKDNISIPLVADIHFDYRMALLAAPIVDKLRINPGNIGRGQEDSIKKVSQVVSAAKEYDVPIRIGVNLGSLEKRLVYEYGYTPLGMVQSAKDQLALLEKLDFYNTVISLKSSSVPKTIEANQIFSGKFDYPLHLGVTEAGPLYQGTVKSTSAFSVLLSQQIGNTVRVSLTDDPVKEVEAAFDILNALEIRRTKRTIVSCPTCARADVDIIGITKQIDELTKSLKKPIQIAVMGCAVNGPGEAKEADFGVACAKGYGTIFKKGQVLRTVKEDQILSALMEQVQEYM